MFGSVLGHRPVIPPDYCEPVRAPVSALDALFTSASAVSTTGLTTVSTGHGFSLFGQLVILALIQIGGIGYMTFGSFVVLSGRGRLSERREQIGKVVFSRSGVIGTTGSSAVSTPPQPSR